MPDVLIVGRTSTLTCSSDLDVTMTEWLYNVGVVQSSTGPQTQLLFNPVNDTIHNRLYTCQVTSPYGVQQQTIIITAEGGVSFNIYTIEPDLDKCCRPKMSYVPTEPLY